MCVTVVDVGIMFMRVNEPLVRVFVTVGLVRTLISRMLVLVVLIMNVAMGVRDRLMRVKMLVSLR